MKKSHDDILRQQLVELIRGGNAHVDFKQVVAGWPAELRGATPAGAPHSAWQVLEHMRIAQWDILEFSRDAAHVSPEFPGGYWPKTEAPPSEKAWDESIRHFKSDLRAMENLVLDPAT